LLPRHALKNLWSKLPDMSILAGEGIDVTLQCGEGEFSAKAGSHHPIFGLSGEHSEMFTGAPVIPQLRSFSR